MGPSFASGLVAFGVLDTTVHAFASVLQGVVTSGVGGDLPSTSPANPAGRVAALLMMHLCFVCGVAVDGDLFPI